jgi:ABC-type dipeptide/oligopeptide/nickel transport system permease subunit
VKVKKNKRKVDLWARVTNPEDRHPFFDQIEKLFKNKTGVAGLIIITLFVLTAILAPLLSPYDPNENSLYDQRME